MNFKALLVAALASAAGAAIVAACGGSDQDSIPVTQGTVIQNATIVNTRDGSLLSGQSVVVVIADFSSHAEANPPATTLQNYIRFNTNASDCAKLTLDYEAIPDVRTHLVNGHADRV